ncbi:hypothetical protein J9332_35075, partial [Aquimarina celericrescens]|nr:hypothetical protein [Aquimarina celericrescens]
QISESDINDGSSDNCGVDSVSIDVTEFDCTMLGDNQVTLTVTDASGNSSTCTTTVTVVDEIIPIVQTQDITVYLDENGLASIESCDLDDGSYDNCSNDSNDIYFTGTFEGEIWKASKDGSTTPELIFTDSETAGPVGIEVDLTSNTIYYGGGNFHSIKYFEIGQTTNSILPGSTSGSERHDFEIHDGYVYYTSDGDLYKGGINSGTAISIVSTGDVIAGITLDKTNNTLYYIAQDNSWGIGKVDIDGNNEDYNYIPTSENARGVTIDESTQTLYWNSGSGNIYSSPADASTAPQLLYDISAYGSGNGYHIDLDGDDLYWTKFNDPNLDDVIFKAPKNGSGPVQVLYSGDFGSIRGIAAGRNITGNSLNCSDFQISQSSFDCTMLGENDVTLTVTDLSGNKNTGSATVTVEDNISPTASCQDVTAYLDENGNVTLDPEDFNDNSSDNTDCFTYTIDQTDFDCTMLGSNPIVFTVEDAAGNIDTCLTTVTIIDNENPTANCVAPFTISLDSNGNAQISESDVNDGSTDNCGVDSISIDVTDFDCTMVGENDVTLTVTDTSGNSSTCTTTVTVIDDINPIANCVAPFTIALDGNGNAQISESDINDGSSDNCGVDSVSI